MAQGGGKGQSVS